jgi:integrase
MPTPDAISHAFADARQAAGITGLRLHDLRREATSRFFERGFSIAEVASITGHKTWAILRRYTVLSPEAIAAKLAKVEA